MRCSFAAAPIVIALFPRHDLAEENCTPQRRRKLFLNSSVVGIFIGLIRRHLDGSNVSAAAGAGGIGNKTIVIEKRTFATTDW